MTKLAFVDTETTGLDPDRHEIWEVGLIIREDVDYGGPARTETEYVWQLPVNLARADQIALNIGKFHERRWSTGSRMNGGSVIGGLATVMADAVADPNIVNRPRIVEYDEMDRWAEKFVDLTWGAHLIGAVPSFDEQRLASLLKRNGQCPGWHYHLIDVETLAIGYIAATQACVDIQPDHPLWKFDPKALPWKSQDLSLAVGVDSTKFAEHEALGDARWAAAIYDEILGFGAPRGTSRAVTVPYGLSPGLRMTCPEHGEIPANVRYIDPVDGQIVRCGLPAPSDADLPCAFALLPEPSAPSGA